MLQSIFFLDSLQQPVPKDTTVLFLKEQLYVQTISYYERCSLLSGSRSEVFSVYPCKKLHSFETIPCKC